MCVLCVRDKGGIGPAVTGAATSEGGGCASPATSERGVAPRLPLRQDRRDGEACILLAGVFSVLVVIFCRLAEV